MTVHQQPGQRAAAVRLTQDTVANDVRFTWRGRRTGLLFDGLVVTGGVVGVDQVVRRRTPNSLLHPVPRIVIQVGVVESDATFHQPRTQSRCTPELTDRTLPTQVAHGSTSAQR